MSKSGLSQLAENLASLAKLPAVICTEAAEGIRDAIEESFEKGQDPYGNPWPPLKSGQRSYLQDTEDMRDSLEVKPMRGAGIDIKIDEQPTIFHQFGTYKMKARPIFPSKEIPEKWARAVSAAYENAMKRRKR